MVNKRLQTFERTGTGMTGHAVALKLDNGEEVVLVAPTLETIARAAAGAGLGEVDIRRVRPVALLPLCSMAQEAKGV